MSEQQSKIVSLEQMLACVRRELALRQRVYPKWTANGKMKQTEADKELTVMQAVHDLLSTFVTSDPKVALHNDLAGRIVSSIVKPTIDRGGDFRDVMVLTESVLMGVCLAGVKLGGDEAVLDTMVTAVKRRLAESRLNKLAPAGTA